MSKDLFYNQAVFRIVAPTLIGTMLYLLILMFFDSISMLAENIFGREILFIIILSYLFFELNRIVILIFNRIYKSSQKIQLRIFFQYLSSFILSFMVVSLALYTYFIYIEGFRTIQIELFTFNSLFLFVAVFYHLFFFSLVYLYRKNETYIQKEKVMRENLDIEFQTFKNQINPDLLFQGLEIIISELHRDRKSADNLINQLSKSYRYTLDNKNNDLVSLQHELDSLLPLSNIYQSKFPSTFKIEVKIKEENLNLNLIPGSLQTLMEHAISENIISKTLPLKMELLEENGRLLFKYPLNEKLTLHHYISDKLEFMERAYNYYSDIGVKTVIQNGSKIISLPLLDIEED